MKFEFCGRLDCPDWILAQLFHASRLELAKFRLICEKVKDTILKDGVFNELELCNSSILSDNQSSSFDIDDARACFGALNYILTNACLSQVEGKQFSDELEQLGLPSEHSEIICSILNENSAEMLEHL